MKKHFISIVIILCGFYYYSEPQINKIDNETKKYEIAYDEMKIIDTGFNFLDIFLNNLIVGIILSIFGFLSGGIITIIVLFWNGYVFSIIFNMAFNLLEIKEILYYSKHIPFEIIGLLAALLTTISFLPQVYKTWKSKDTKALSLTMYILFFIGVSMWILYGFYINSLPIIVANIITAISALILIGLKLKYK